MSAEIVRYGYISAVGDGRIRVRLIVEGENCSACSVATVCGKGEDMEVPYPGASADLVGAKVRVRMRGAAMPAWASLLMPLLILVAVAVGLLMAGVPDLWCVGAALVAISLWYISTHIYNRHRGKILSVEHFPET